ncbi:MAG TPA: class II aldolase/adducin family protein [Acidimicrobiales bacterium]|nr:class II aldolase/adducin family protein [Acidimicrobiales bacterium]
MTDTRTGKPTQMKAMRVTKPIAPALELTPRQELALMARVLWQEGYQDHLAGHITYRQPDGTFLVNPFGLTWGELKASDVMRMDEDGNELEGPWTITPAIELHVVLHKARPNLTVALHNHTRWGTIWADIGRAPEIFDQTSAMYHGEVAVYDEYWGAVDDETNAKAAVEAMGDANVALLANHGVLIVGDDIEQTYLRSMAFEWRCRQAWHMAVADGGKPMDPDAAAAYGGFFNTANFTGLFPAMCRAEVARDRSVLD